MFIFWPFLLLGRTQKQLGAKTYHSWWEWGCIITRCGWNKKKYFSISLNNAPRVRGVILFQNWCNDQTLWKCVLELKVHILLFSWHQKFTRRRGAEHDQKCNESKTEGFPQKILKRALNMVENHRINNGCHFIKPTL